MMDIVIKMNQLEAKRSEALASEVSAMKKEEEAMQASENQE